jgi:hypothetical protein
MRVCENLADPRWRGSGASTHGALVVAKAVGHVIIAAAVVVVVVGAVVRVLGVERLYACQLAHPPIHRHIYRERQREQMSKRLSCGGRGRADAPSGPTSASATTASTARARAGVNSSGAWHPDTPISAKHTQTQACAWSGLGRTRTTTMAIRRLGRSCRSVRPPVEPTVSR